jgi:amino acid transporter
MASRLLYGMAGEGIVPQAFGRIHPSRRTPWVAIVFTAAVTVVLLLTGEIGDLADTTVLLLLIVFASVNASVLVLRKETVTQPHFRSPTVMPVIGMVVSVAVMTTKDAETFARAGVLLLIGGLLWKISR